MLSSPLPLPLEEPPGFELSPLFGFLDGFSDWLVFFLLALKKRQIIAIINIKEPPHILKKEKHACNIIIKSTSEANSELPTV